MHPLLLVSLKVKLTFDPLGLAARDLTGLHPSSPLRLKVDVFLVASEGEHACASDQGQHCCILQIMIVMKKRSSMS